MNKIIAILLLCLVALPLRAQHRYQEVLDAVEQNNPMLKALRQQSMADSAAIGVGEILNDPEVEFGYYWGSPAEVGKRWDLSVTQSFEMPSVYLHKKRLHNLQRHATTLQYEVARAALFYEVQKICADWIYYDAVHHLCSGSVTNAIRVAELYQKRYAAGDCNVLEYNRAQLYLAELQATSAAAGLQADHALHELWKVTAADGYVLQSELYAAPNLPESFDGWYQQQQATNSNLRYLSNAVDEKEKEVALSRSEWLPKVHVGYASENVVGETFSGVVAGITLPLWNNRGNVQRSRLAAAAAVEALRAEKIDNYRHLMCTFHRAKAVENNLRNLEQAYNTYNSAMLLLTALEAGEISLEEYLQGLASYVEIELQIWQTRHELEYLVLELNAVAL